MLNKPQRQEPVGLIIEIGLSAIKIAKAFWPILLMFVLKGTGGKEQKLLLYGGILVLLIIVTAILRYINFKFYIDEINNEFVLQKGILSKEKIIIKLNNVFEVNLEQKYLHILLGVFKVKLDTASSDKDEVVIQSLSKQNADLLRNYILNYKNQHKKAETSDQEQIDIANDIEDEIATNNDNQISISFISLLKASLISNYAKTIGIIIIFFNTIFENLREFNDVFFDKFIENEQVANALSNSVAAMVILFVLLFILLNLVIGLFQHFGYVITKNKNQLIIKYGLIQKFQIIVKPSRIQYFTSFTSKLMRWFNVYSLQLALIGDPSDKKQKSSIKIPALSLSNLQNIKQYLGIGNTSETFYFSLNPNFRYVIQNMLVLTLIIVAAFMYFSFLGDKLFIFEGDLLENKRIYIIIAIVMFWIFILVIQILNLKKYNIQLFADSIVITQGVLQTRTTVLPIKNIQSLKIKQAWWHQNSNLATLELNTAGGKIVLPIANQELYTKILNFVLFEIESKNKSWI